MEQSLSWEANGSSASQGIPHILSRKPPPVPIVSQINKVHATHPISYVKIHIVTIFPTAPRSSKRSFSIRSAHQNRVWISSVSHTCHISCSSHSAWFAHPNSVRWGVQTIQLIQNMLYFFSQFLWTKYFYRVTAGHAHRNSCTIRLSQEAFVNYE